MNDTSIASLPYNILLNEKEFVRRYLEDDPGNSEYADMAKELEEVIVLTEELLEAAKQGEIPALNIGTNDGASPSQHLSDDTSRYALVSNETSEQFERFPVGTKVEAVYSEDGEWYEATIESHTPNGYFVTYNEWGNKEEVKFCIFPPVSTFVV
ncbi:hypothetical protein ACHQM5_017317 [Ranunculus cassubicifolius]